MGFSVKKIFLYSLLLLVVFVASVLVHLPAKFVTDNLPSIPGLKISGVDGSIWQGSAGKVVFEQYDIGQVSWDMQLAKLFTGKAELNVRFGRDSALGLDGRGIVGYGFSGPYAENLIASIPVEKVMQQVSIPAPVTAKGDLELMVRHYSFAQPWCKSAQGNLRWNQGKVESPMGNLELGTVTSDISCQDNVLKATGNQQNKQVSAQFTAQLQSNFTYDLDAWFKPGVEFPEKLSQQLKWLGDPDAKGHYPLVFSGRL
ncbi:type II secretion system protein N [Vibrio gallicus]|uniref:type II secretion system protein N n=1 Tax=Vibrio gallicus TaxID=190897 RepID=UPI0021C4A848|nr:type II secretion system protein N [Vibrio gallicus]